MDGLKRQERKRAEKIEEEIIEEVVNDIEEEQDLKQKPERRTFLDKLTERVKDFLDNAE
jgi:cell division protein FtsA